VDEAKDIRDKALAVAAYARQANDEDMIRWAMEIRLRAERRAGTLLARVERAQGKRTKGNAPVSSALKETGIGEAQAHRWQTMAQYPEADVRRLEAECTEAQTELTSAEVYRLAKGGAHVQHNTGEPEWYTPREIIAAARDVLGAIDLDPVSPTSPPRCLRPPGRGAPRDGTARRIHLTTR